MCPKVPKTVYSAKEVQHSALRAPEQINDESSENFEFFLLGYNPMIFGRRRFSTCIYRLILELNFDAEILLLFHQSLTHFLYYSREVLPKY